MPENIAIFESGLAEAALGGYSELQRQNWAQSKDIIIYENETQLREFIKNARNDKSFKGKMYFGTIYKDLADRTKNDTGVNIEGYNVSLTANEIRKIYEDHGSEATEFPRGQRAITEDDFVNIPRVIQNPDKIELASDTYNGKPAIKFIKTINGRTTVVSWVSDKHRDLRVQTMYSGKNRDGTLAAPVAEQATTKTPEATSGTGSVINNIQKYFSEEVNSASLHCKLFSIFLSLSSP